MEVVCLDGDRVDLWFPYDLSSRFVLVLIENVGHAQERESSGLLGADRLYIASTVAWVVASAEQCILMAAITNRGPAFPGDPEVVDPPLASRRVPDVYGLELHRES